MSYSATDPISVLPGVGPARAQKLQRMGLENIGQLLRWYPRDYQDRTRYATILQAPEEEAVCIPAVVASQPKTAHIRRGLDVTRVKAVDDTGVLEVTFFNQNWVASSLQVGQSCIFFGKAEGEGNRRRMTNPYLEPPSAERQGGRILPIYPLTQGITNPLLLGLVRRVLPWAEALLPETLPPAVLEEYGLPPLATACRWLHQPERWEDINRGRERLAFEDIFFLTIGLTRLKGRRCRTRGIPCREGRLEDFFQALPFCLTVAQRRAAEDCAGDMAGEIPMNRLVQGDVGSGKTAVAAAAVYLVVKSGHQAAMMAPTEILAEQHFRTLSGFLTPLGVRVTLVTGSMKAKERRELQECLALGMIDLLVGTHALISAGIELPHLALVITDEQHRFGVNQRATLTGKGQNPHVLVMSATPIPRTLALMVYGDLDVSVIDELPPGRQQVQTLRVHTDKRQRMYQFVRRQVQEGHQVFIVCPAVEEETPPDTAAPELQSVMEYAQRLKTQVFPDLRVEYLHGKMKPRVKEAVMAAVVAGEVDVLVSTTVIEVGVDVPNATLMIVENAERFGLSQLHQLRGRVGRGTAESWCVLVSDARGETAQARLKALCSTNDGFRIAEEDLQLRGPGDFFGARQHGLPQLKMAELAGDTRVVELARRAAVKLLDADYDLQLPQHRMVRERVAQMFEASPDIFN